MRGYCHLLLSGRPVPLLSQDPAALSMGVTLSALFFLTDSHLLDLELLGAVLAWVVCWLVCLSPAQLSLMCCGADRWFLQHLAHMAAPGPSSLTPGKGHN